MCSLGTSQRGEELSLSAYPTDTDIKENLSFAYDPTALGRGRGEHPVPSPGHTCLLGSSDSRSASCVSRQFTYRQHCGSLPSWDKYWDTTQRLCINNHRVPSPSSSCYRAGGSQSSPITPPPPQHTVIQVRATLHTHLASARGSQWQEMALRDGEIMEVGKG